MCLTDVFCVWTPSSVNMFVCIFLSDQSFSQPSPASAPIPPKPLHTQSEHQTCVVLVVMFYPGWSILVRCTSLPAGHSLMTAGLVSYLCISLPSCHVAPETRWRPPPGFKANWLNVRGLNFRSLTKGDEISSWSFCHPLVTALLLC